MEPMTDTDKLKRLAEMAAVFNYEGWEYISPRDGLSSGMVRASNHGPVLAVIQWPVPTMDHVLAGLDASLKVGEFIAASNPQAILALIAENEALNAYGRDVAREAVQYRKERDEAVALLNKVDPFVSTLAIGASELQVEINEFLARIDAAD